MITIADYIYELRELQSTLDSIRGDLDIAVSKIENEDVTGSRLSVLACSDLLKASLIDLKRVAIAKIF